MRFDRRKKAEQRVLPWAWRLGAIGCLLNLACAQLALAHRNFLDARFSVASGGLADFGFNGQYGFTPELPVYLYGEAARGVFTEEPRDSFSRAGAEIGYESTHLGAALRYGAILTPSSSLTATRLGGTIFYRFASWNWLSAEERILLEREERQARIRENTRRTALDIPRAALLAANFDTLTLATDSSPRGGVQGVRYGLWLRAFLNPVWTWIPSVDFYSYDRLPSQDPLGLQAYSSRSLRWVRLGPSGHSSAIYGAPTSTQQLYSEIKLFPQLWINAAATRASLDAPSGVGYSLWIGFDRFLDPKKRWALSPSYEHYILEGKSSSFFTLSLRFGAADVYLPQAD